MKLAETKDHAVYTAKSQVYKDFCVAVSNQLTDAQKDAIFLVVATLVSSFEKQTKR